MSLETLGVIWHLDHKIPLGLFDLTDLTQQLEAVHFTNLQPLLTQDHIEKTKLDNRIIRTHLLLKGKSCPCPKCSAI
jgi:hypothetical protein